MGSPGKRGFANKLRAGEVEMGGFACWTGRASAWAHVVIRVSGCSQMPRGVGEESCGGQESVGGEAMGGGMLNVGIVRWRGVDLGVRRALSALRVTS